MFTRLIQRALPPGLTFRPGALAVPSQCAVCLSWPADAVCAPCIARFAAPTLRCERCALGLPDDLSFGLRAGPPLCGPCAVSPPPLDITRAALPYAYPWSTLIAAYKFRDQHGWADFFAGLLLRSAGVRELLADLSPDDWLLPIPLSAERLETRGFNQAWLLARALAKRSHTPAQIDARLLLRVRHTRPQSQLKREARLANVKGAFVVEPLRQPALDGRRVVLVDDVMTSGASLFTAAQALRDAGASHVSAVVLARTAAG